jgi:hypothetical protein
MPESNSKVEYDGLVADEYGSSSQDKNLTYYSSVNDEDIKNCCAGNFTTQGRGDETSLPDCGSQQILGADNVSTFPGNFCSDLF